MTNDVKTALISRNITINKKRTSIRLETQMWNALKDIAELEKCTIHNVCELIANQKSDNITLTAAIRVFLVLYYKSATTDAGHKRAGHGDFNKMMERSAKMRAINYDNDSALYDDVGQTIN
jgi:predicted DNA-binding ribbon-helix-helix protein